MNKIEKLKKAEAEVKEVRIEIVEKLGTQTSKREMEAEMAAFKRISEIERMINKQWKLWSINGEKQNTSTQKQEK